MMETGATLSVWPMGGESIGPQVRNYVATRIATPTTSGATA